MDLRIDCFYGPLNMHWNSWVWITFHENTPYMVHVIQSDATYLVVKFTGRNSNFLKRTINVLSIRQEGDRNKCWRSKDAIYRT